MVSFIEPVNLEFWFILTHIESFRSNGSAVNTSTVQLKTFITENPLVTTLLLCKLHSINTTMDGIMIQNSQDLRPNLAGKKSVVRNFFSLKIKLILFFTDTTL